MNEPLFADTPEPSERRSGSDTSAWNRPNPLEHGRNGDADQLLRPNGVAPAGSTQPAYSPPADAQPADDRPIDTRPVSARPDRRRRSGSAAASERHDYAGNEPLLVASGVTRVFSTAAGGKTVDRVANNRIDLQVRPGELVVVAGSSGAGKTTLLNLLAGLDRPTAGAVSLAGRNYADCSDRQLSQLRREYIGYVFQAFGLLPMLSARENVEVPLRLLRMSAAERDARVVQVLGEVGLAGHLDQRPYELSGGQQQRVSLARALVARPRLLLADEPTGQLDSATADGILRLIQHLVHRLGVAAVVATHDEELMGMADRLVQLTDGVVVDPVAASTGRHGRPD